MADQSNFYSDGSPKWGTKSNIQATNIPIPPTSTERIITGLVNTDVKTDVVNISIKIVKNNSVLAHFIINNISSTDISGNQLKVFSADELPVTLEFISNVEAQIADDRFTICLNGGTVI